MRRSLWAIALLVAMPLTAQSVRGKVVEADRQVAISGALVELSDSTGHPLLRMLTTASGAYAFLVERPGRYAVRVAAIGFIPIASQPITVPGNGVSLPEFALSRAVFKLPDLVAASRTRACGLSEMQSGTFADVLESARSALQVVDAAFASGSFKFRVQVIHTSEFKGSTRRSAADTATALLDSWPVQSTDLDSLRRVGFAREPTANEPPGMIYYGPDARVLFADWFLQAHCFTLEVDKRGESDDSVRMRFEPRQKLSRVDLTGELIFDRATMSLRRLEFRHVHMPAGIPEGSAGGRIEFDRWPSGLWLPTGWAIWGPIESVTFAAPVPIRGMPMTARAIPHRTAVGSAQLSGKVLEVVRP